jgi:hypothetical protein
MSEENKNIEENHSNFREATENYRQRQNQKDSEDYKAYRKKCDEKLDMSAEEFICSRQTYLHFIACFGAFMKEYEDKGVIQRYSTSWDRIADSSETHSDITIRIKLVPKSPL